MRSAETENPEEEYHQLPLVSYVPEHCRAEEKEVSVSLWLEMRWNCIFGEVRSSG
jgi:hypothetical protein